MSKENYYPSVATDFIISQLLCSDKIILDSQRKVGNTIVFLCRGSQAMHRRTIILRDFNGEINFDQASALAARFRFLGNFIEWLKVNKNWKEGSYLADQ
jgi:hypothetical protein